MDHSAFRSKRTRKGLFPARPVLAYISNSFRRKTNEKAHFPEAAPEAAPATEAAPAGIDGEIAIFWYTFGDTYLSSVRAAMNEALAAAGVKAPSFRVISESK